jgi:hypothetical protein
MHDDMLMGTMRDRGITHRPAYFLREHAFLCQTAHHWVILDRDRDQYLCIARRDFELLTPWLQGYCEQQQRDTGAMPELARELATALVAKGILSQRTEQTKSARPVSTRTPTKALDTHDLRASRARSIACAPLVLLAARKASQRLESEPLAATIRRIENRKKRHSGAAIADLRRYAPHVATFNTVRPLVPRSYQCLFDSLALLEFLALRRLFPIWTFGVMSDPFQAHCWLEADGCVLNDTVEKISLYVPIMRI